MKYSPNKIERKWQRYWAKQKLHETPDTVTGKANSMLLTEFPYPSGNLHIGHWYTFAVSDILVRYLRMKGNNVLYPIGFDAFGLPAENAAIQRGVNPRDWTEKNIAYMTKQLKSMGASFDWSRVVSTIDPDYYKWTQWMFLKFYEKGLAYRAKTKVNWCPKDKTVLANEQVVNNCCERCDTPVVQKEIEQWMFKITAYADRLIDDLGPPDGGLDWPETIKLAQRNWIGRSEGAIIKFSIFNFQFSIDVFTTRADTLAGATYVVLAPEHPLVKKVTTDDRLNAVNAYLESVRCKPEFERLNLEKEKTGVFTGSYAVNPLTEEKIPVWIADYVIGTYGTGAVMAVPGHDQRDFEFAKKYKLPIQKVIDAPDARKDGASVEDGTLMHSGIYDGLSSADARLKIVSDLGKKGLAKIQRNYRLHDWVLSRQRYWGVPIPMVRCATCGYQPVPEEDLPVKLPKLDDFKPTDDGRSPLAKATKWLDVKCPQCKSDAERETDTMDTFVDSSWYFIRYTDPKNKKQFADSEKMKAWLPVPMYIGGAEHNTMHLLYSRFFTKALYDLGFVHFSEPFTGRRNHGVMLGPDGQKMSKSRGNVVDPDDLIGRFGADTVRMYLAFMAPYDQAGPWDPKGINGAYRFLQRVRKLAEQHQHSDSGGTSQTLLHKAIKKIGDDVAMLHFNTGVSELMKLLNHLEETRTDEETMSTFMRLLAPFAPHLAEEIWRGVLKKKTSIHLEPWPSYDERLLAEETISMPVQVNGKVRDVIMVLHNLTGDAIKKQALTSEKVKKHIADKTIRKVIVIPGKLISIVAS